MDLLSIGEFARLARLSPKALRLYDRSGLLPPAEIDAVTGYRRYAPEQLEAARLIAALRQLDMPLAQIAPVLRLDEAARVAQVASWWVSVGVEHAARQQLVGFLMDRMSGRNDVAMPTTKNEVELRELPARPVLCLMRHVHGDGLMAAGKEFIGKFRGASIRPASGVNGAPFVIYYGEVNQDSDGPIEWCWPVEEGRAEELAARFPELNLRTDPAHQEAFVFQGPAAQVGQAQAALAIESLLTWAAAEHRQVTGGIRQVYLSNPANGGTGPDCDLAISVR